MNIKYQNFIEKAKDLYYEDELKKSLKMFELALDYAENEDKIDIYYNQALILDEMEEYEHALEKFKKIFYLDLTQARALYGVAMEYEKLGHLDLSETFYRYSIDIDPEYDRAYFFLANLLDNQNRYEEAIKYYKKTIELKPEDYMAYNNLGAIYENTDKFEDALEALDKSIQIEPKYFRPYFNKGVVYGRLKEYDRANECYLESIKRNCKYSFNYLNMSALFISRKMYEKSIEILNEGIKNADNNLENLYYNRACSYIKLGYKDKCLEDLNKSIELDPDIVDYAKKDEDFDTIKETDEFKKAVK